MEYMIFRKLYYSRNTKYVSQFYVTENERRKNKTKQKDRKSEERWKSRNIPTNSPPL